MKRFIVVLIALGLMAGFVSCANSNAEDNRERKCVAEYIRISDSWFNALAQFSDAKDRDDLLDAIEKARNQFSNFSEWVLEELSQLQEQRENLFEKYADDQNQVCAQIGQFAKRISVPYGTTITDVLRQKKLLLTNY